MAKTEGTYIQVAYKNVFGYISTNSWPFFMFQRSTIREKCAWVRSNTWRDERPVFFGFSIFQQMSQLATKKIQNLCNRNRWSGLLQLGSVQFPSFLQSSKLDLRTLVAMCSKHSHSLHFTMFYSGPLLILHWLLNTIATLAPQIVMLVKLMELGIDWSQQVEEETKIWWSDLAEDNGAWRDLISLIVILIYSHYSRLPHNPYLLVDCPGYGVSGSMDFKERPNK